MNNAATKYMQDVAVRAQFELRSANLRRLRESRGWSLGRLSRATGVGRVFLGEMENARRTITLRTIDRLATALDLTPAQVLGELDGR